MTTNNHHSQIEFELGFDRELAWHRGDSVRYLLAELKAPDVAADREQESRGVNLSLVIDASGSMQGGRLEAAKHAAMGVIDRLSEKDCLSVVSFSDDVRTHVESRPMDSNGRSEAISEVANLNTRGMTNLSDGWLAGAEHVAAQIERRSGAQHHVVLLSDGKANQGITDPRHLAQIAGEIHDRGVSTSTVGIGNDYSPVQLQAIAEACGGRMHDAETIDEIIEVVISELGELGQVVAEQVELDLVVPAGIQIEPVGSSVFKRSDERCRCSLGSLVGSSQRQIAFKITVPSGAIGSRLEFEAHLRWQRPGDWDAERNPVRQATLTFADGKENSVQFRSVKRSETVARLWQSAVVRQAVQLNREHNYHQAMEFLATEIRFFERYCAGLPGTKQLIDQLQRTLETIDRPWRERSRKEVELANYKFSKGERDVRRAKRASWEEFLPDPDS